MILKYTVIFLVAAAAMTVPSSSRAATTFRLLHSFGASGDGTNPWGPPVLDCKGNLYGFTATGGTGQCSDYGCGIVYELSPRQNGTWREEVLHHFTNDGNGEFPWGAPIFDTAGNLFGTSVGDTDGTPSTAFELSPTPDGWLHTVLYTGGAGPGLLMDRLGNLYGDIGSAKEEFYDAVGELSHTSDGWTYTRLYGFCSQQDCADGWDMYHPPIWDGPDKLYGATYYGGTGEQECLYGCGVIFRMIRNSDGTWTYQVLHRFLEYSPTDGTSPAAGLVMDAAGNFYGSTLFGGPNTNGTIFKLAFSDGHWKETQLYTFPNCDAGCLPGGTMVFDKAGNLYGTASGGIAACDTETCGTVFKLTPQKNGKWKYSVVYKFHGPDGNGPVAVIIDSHGHLFGTTASGGKYNQGVAFEITP